MTVRSSSKRIQTLGGHFYAVLFAIIVFKKYRPTYLSRVSRGGQLKTQLNLYQVSTRLLCGREIIRHLIIIIIIATMKA